MITVGANVSLNLWLVRVMGYGGLALGTAIASLLNAGLLMILLSRRVGGVDGSRVFGAFFKIALASVVMGAVAYWTELRLSSMTGDGSDIARAIPVAGAIAAGVLALAITAKILRLAEFEDAMSAILRRLRRSGTGR
jgi:putative peptidoglycan lipid II flippase